ncbi:ArsR family transcriptional regulator [Pseudoduganella sp. R-32]|jgi:DNA-binding transcriptional ArsR family regulator|uniref:ArsR family transcriptional regulator n=1 Tax=unclassified Pseudoduganella TaxID=2637179 RepID=UPI003CED5DAE
MIASALFTPAQQKLLGLLFVRVNEGFHLNEIMRLTGLGSASAQRELKRLHESGLIVSERIGNVRRFRPNKENLVYPELASLVKKTFGLVSVLNSALAPMRKQLSVAFVYGTTVKQAEDSSAPVELLLIGENTTYGELLSRLPVAERLLRRKINPNLYSVDDFQRRLREQQPFILKMLGERKVFVLGDDTDLDHIIKEVHPEDEHGDALPDI